jgi:hypothetical protein
VSTVTDYSPINFKVSFRRTIVNTTSSAPETLIVYGGSLRHGLLLRVVFMKMPTTDRPSTKRGILGFDPIDFQRLQPSSHRSRLMDATDLDALRTKEYWNTRYENEPEGHEFDWFKNYEELAPLLKDLLQPEEKILMLGCGNSVWF